MHNYIQYNYTFHTTLQHSLHIYIINNNDYSNTTVPNEHIITYHAQVGIQTTSYPISATIWHMHLLDVGILKEECSQEQLYTANKVNTNLLMKAHCNWSNYAVHNYVRMWDVIVCTCIMCASYIIAQLIVNCISIVHIQ